MTRWTIDEPTKLDFDGVVALKATLVAGDISVLPTDDKPSLHVTGISGHPLEVVHEAGMLTLTHATGGLDGVLKWLQDTKGRATVTVCVPRDCPVRLNLGTAGAVITGLGGRVSVKTASGDVTLDRVTGAVDATTATGAMEAQGLDGDVTFNSVSGDLSLAGGTLRRLTAHSVSGKVTADVRLTRDSQVQASTVSGEITVRLPDTVHATVSLSSFRSRIDSGFAELDATDRTVGKGVSGTIGDGSASLSLSSVSGPVTLLSRREEALSE